MSLQSAWVIVTGADGGMGRAIIHRSIADGYRVLGLDLAFDDLRLNEEAARRFHPLQVDVTTPDLGARVFEALVDATPGEASADPTPERLAIHGVVNLAGISRGADIFAISDEDWAESFDVNVTGPMRLLRSVVPYMKAGASIVNVASPVALVGARKVSYAASKAALFGLNAAIARGLGARGIRSNIILPGPTISKMTADWSDEKRAAIAAATLLGRLCAPEDIAGAVSFLLGPDSAFMTGATLDLTGGSLIGVTSPLP